MSHLYSNLGSPGPLPENGLRVTPLGGLATRPVNATAGTSGPGGGSESLHSATPGRLCAGPGSESPAGTGGGIELLTPPA